MKHVILNGFILCKTTEYEILSLSGISFASNVKIPSRARVRVKRLKYIISVKLPPKAFKLRQQSAREMCIAIKVPLFETNSEICHRLHRRDEDVLVLMCEFQSSASSQSWSTFSSSCYTRFPYADAFAQKYWLVIVDFFRSCEFFTLNSLFFCLHWINS